MCSTAFQFLYVTHAIDKVNGHDLSNTNTLCSPGKENDIDVILTIKGGM